MSNFFASVTLFFKDQFTAGATQAKTGFNSMAKAAESLGKSNALLDTASKLSIATSMTEPFRQKLSAALQGPSTLAAGLDSSFKNIQSVTGATGAEMAKLQGQLIAVGGTSVAGIQATVDTFYDIAGGVTDASVRMPTLTAALSMAEAGQADLGASTKGLISVMNSYSFSADKAMFASDVFTRTVGAGVGSMDEFVSAMSPMAGLASSVGMKFDDLGASLAFMTTKGATASLAATQTKAAIVALLNPNEKMAKLFARMGVESGSAMIKQYGLAGALSQIKDALGGSSDAMAKVLGSTEALQGATTLTDATFKSFSETFASGLDGITKSARAVQLEAYEAKMSRLKSSQDAFAAKMGESSNKITGFFADIKTGFYQAAMPILSTPLGDALAPTVAVLAMGAEKALAFGGGALQAASQLATLAATAQSAGGLASLFGGGWNAAIGTFKDKLGGALGATSKLGKGISTFNASVKNVGLLETFKNGITGIGHGFGSLGKGIVAALPKMGAWIASTWSAVAAHVALNWPIYAVIAAIALLAAGVILVIKNWGAISDFFTRLWNGVKNTFGRAFAFLWGFCDSGIGQAFMVVFMPLIGVPILIAKHWGAISGFFVGLWDGVKSVFSSAFTFIWGLFDNKAVQAALVVFMPIIGIPTAIIKNWEPIKTFFVGLWAGITTVFQAAIAKIEGFFTGMWTVIQKPFKAVGDFFSKVFGGAFASGKASMDAFSSGIGQGSATVTASTAKAFDAPSKYFPHSDAPVGPFSTLTSSGRALMTTFADGMDGTPVARELDTAFSGALDPVMVQTMSGKGGDEKARGSTVTSAGPTVQHFHIEKDIVIQAENIKTAMDFVEILMAAARVPA